MLGLFASARAQVSASLKGIVSHLPLERQCRPQPLSRRTSPDPGAPSEQPDSTDEAPAEHLSHPVAARSVV